MRDHYMLFINKLCNSQHERQPQNEQHHHQVPLIRQKGAMQKSAVQATYHRTWQGLYGWGQRKLRQR